MIDHRDRVLLLPDSDELLFGDDVLDNVFGAEDFRKINRSTYRGN